MPPNDEEFHTSAMVDAVREMTRKLDQFQRHADDERQKLRSEVGSTIEAMRKDIHAVTSRLQLDAMQHKDEHLIDRKERISRQLILNLVLGALIALGVLNLILTIMR